MSATALLGVKKKKRKLQKTPGSIKGKMPWSYPGFSFFFFLTEVTSNLHIEVSVPLGNTKEATPQPLPTTKRDSPRHIATHFVIHLDGKSILKLGPLDSSEPEVLLSQHSCTHESLQVLASRRHFLPGLLPLLSSV